MLVNDYQENYSSGWIRLYRSIENNGFYKKSAYIHLWVHILLKANHQKTEMLHNGRLKKLKAGQFITGRNRLSLETGISGTTIERILKVFENGQMIGQETDSHSRIITVLNWDLYQKVDSKTDKQRTDSGQTADTNNNEKNDNNEKKEYYRGLFKTEQTWKGFMQRTHKTSLEQIEHYLSVYIEMCNFDMVNNISDIKFGFNKWMKGENPEKRTTQTIAL